MGRIKEQISEAYLTSPSDLNLNNAEFEHPTFIGLIDIIKMFVIQGADEARTTLQGYPFFKADDFNPNQLEFSVEEAV